MDIRPITREEFPKSIAVFNRAMGFPPPDESYIATWQPAFHPERSLCAFDGEQLVGNVYSHPFELTLPGNTQLDVAGVTAVGVLPTHKRRRIITELKTRQLREAKDRGEAAAILIASESVIYGRFGYGVSSYLVDVELETRFGAYRSGLNDPGGRVVFVDEDAADKIFPDLHDRWRKQQPGAIERMEQWWQGVRNDRKPGQHAHVVYESDGGDVEGYLRYEVRPKWDAGLASHSLAEHDFVTLTPRSRQALWRHVLDVDLVRAVHMGGQPVDDPIRWWLANPRAMKVTRYGDFFWTRILHIERSLEARHYRADTALVIEIRDALFPDNSGRYALTIDAGVASCERTEKAPDLVMPIASLGSLFLGGVTASNLARGGQIEERSDGALARCDAAFSSDVQPWSATWF